jgi:hypothetical protein
MNDLHLMIGFVVMISQQFSDAGERLAHDAF